ncbi:MAG: hypothetical protein CM15mP1_1100 [Methanobacteriota archaeon]|nr:MAG: hypothetical protein CM15mP1_1100 [Euryarchaeota archaeon]
MVPKRASVTNDLLTLCKGKRIIDVGAGPQPGVQSLIDREFQVTVLDISSEALQILSSRHGDAIDYKLGDLSSQLELGEYDIWHDRAVLHFYLRKKSINHMFQILSLAYLWADLL